MPPYMPNINARNFFGHKDCKPVTSDTYLISVGKKRYLGVILLMQMYIKLINRSKKLLKLKHQLGCLELVQQRHFEEGWLRRLEQGRL